MSKQIAEALVECGYADYQGVQKIYSKGTEYLAVYWIDPEIDDTCEPVDPFADTLEGRRQAEALEDWLHKYHGNLLKRAKHSVGVKFPYNGRQKRLDRIEWCFEQLEAQSEG